MKDPIKLLIVDDSIVMRQVIRNIFESVPHIKVVGEAHDGKMALEMIPELSPDVITLDINMPVMDGLTALKHIMIRFPRPVVMCSTLTREGDVITFDSLKYGAVDFIHKPSNRYPDSLEKQYATIIKKITLASKVKMESVRIYRHPKGQNALKRSRPGNKKLQRVCAIGASEGGCASLLKIIPHIQANLPLAFLVILHESSGLVDSFIRYLKGESEIRVQKGINGAPLKPGVCYMASGQEYMTVAASKGRYTLRVSPSPFPGRRGSINMLMLTLAEVMGDRSMGIILSGSGNDGAEGMSEIIRKGGVGIVQHPASCLHKEMALSALDYNKAAKIIADRDMAAKINKKYGHQFV